MESNTLLLLVLVAVLVAIGLLLVLLLRRPEDRMGGLLRDEQRAGRGELREQLEGFASQQGQRIDGFGAQLQAVAARTDQRLDEFTVRTDARLDELRAALTEDARKARLEAAEQQARHAGSLGQTLQELTARNELRIGEMRDTLETQLKSLQADNAAKLEQMRATVDEKLHATLETRLTESFGNVATMLAQVHQGLGDMHSLAADVGGLQRVLSNVKSRGVLGEVQLAGCWSRCSRRTSTPAMSRPCPAATSGSNSRSSSRHVRRRRGVAADRRQVPAGGLRAPAGCAGARRRGRGEAPAKRWKPGAHEAKKIREKYVAAPHTTDFAILFLPTEGLYAEVLRRPGLVDALQRDQRIAVAGPDHAAGADDQLPDGLPHAGDPGTLQRGVAGAGRGQDRVRQVRRRARRRAEEAAGSQQQDRGNRQAHARADPQAARRGSLAERRDPAVARAPPTTTNPTTTPDPRQSRCVRPGSGTIGGR